MGVGPAHGSLQRQVQAVEGDICGYLQRTGDRRLDIFKRDLQFDDAHGCSPFDCLCPFTMAVNVSAR